MGETMTGDRISVIAEYKGFACELDYAITCAVGREPDGSGVDLQSQVRDLSFSFYQKPAANRAIARINEIEGVTARVWE